MKKFGVRRVLVHAAFIFCVALVGTGCGLQEPPQAEVQPEPREFELVTEAYPEGLDIYVVLNVYTNSYWQRLVKGVTEAGNEHSCNVYVGGSAKEEGRYQVQEYLLNEAVSRGADAIVVAPVSSEGQVNHIGEIFKGGTPIILVDSSLNSGNYSLCLMTDNLKAGELAAKEMLRQFEAAGVPEEQSAQVAIQLGSPTNQTLVDRLAGFSRYWYRHAPEAWTIIDDVKCNNGDGKLAVQYGKEYLDGYPGLKGVFSCNNGSTIGFANALTESGRTDVIIVGFDFSDELAALVYSEDYMASAIVQSPYQMGYLGVEMAGKLARGEDLGRKFMDTGVYAVNSENINEPLIQSMLNN